MNPWLPAIGATVAVALAFALDYYRPRRDPDLVRLQVGPGLCFHGTLEDLEFTVNEMSRELSRVRREFTESGEIPAVDPDAVGGEP